MRRRIRWLLPCSSSSWLVAAAMTAASSHANPPAGGATATPIKHVVVIFQENVSFDHYFGTYPYATNTDGNNFTAAQGTPGRERAQLLAARREPERVEPAAARQLQFRVS